MVYLLRRCCSLVHYQYGRRPSMEAISDRMLPSVPSSYWFTMLQVLSAHYHSFVQLSLCSSSTVSGSKLITERLQSKPISTASRYKHTRLMQLGFFLLSITSSIRLVYIINRSNFSTNMKQVCPVFRCNAACSHIYLFRHHLWPRLLYMRSCNASCSPHFWVLSLPDAGSGMQIWSYSSDTRRTNWPYIYLPSS